MTNEDELLSLPAVPQADDTDADADISRPSRVMQYRVQQRSQFSMAIPALLLVALGILYSIHALTPESQILTPLTALGAALGALGIGLVARFLGNGRKETGVLFLGLLILFWAAVGAAVAFNAIDPSLAIPFTVSAVGMAILGMLPFVRERGLALPGLVFVVAGVTLLPFATNLLGPDLIRVVTLIWPILLIILALLFLPRAFRGRTR